MTCASQSVTRKVGGTHLARLNFYPIGNADTTLIELNDGRDILVDFCYENRDDGRIDLAGTLQTHLKKRNRDWFDVVAFTHADNDHVSGAESFFYLDYAKQYQGDGRVHIHELWVPACFILDEGPGKSAWAIRQEAKYRLRQGHGILVFGEPETLLAWMRKQGLDANQRKHLIVHAGTCIPGFTQYSGGVEIFLHAPFSARMDEDNSDRNGNSIVLHLTFFEGNHSMYCMMGADAEAATWIDIVTLTRMHGNHQRLIWDLFHISHHCSYTGLTIMDKGETETVPEDAIDDLFNQAQRYAILISPSEKIQPFNTTQPPHFQAAAYYKRVADRVNGQFIVTMDWPRGTAKPTPVVVVTTVAGFQVQKDASKLAGSPVIINHSSPRFG